MPCVIIGGVKINSVASGSNVHFGDAGIINLTSSCKVITGNNSLSPGDSYGSNQNVLGHVNTIDSDVVDTPNTTV
ncbi:spore germination protein [Gorillibacterium sp. sgz5001074]|uniref:spore germination protein n=1 Tax=Gorillibacterium sp. sgz5001074 TaxID=3446695 RepID=UPI003F681DC0